MSLVIKGGKAFVSGHFTENDILIEDGLIKEIGTGLKGDETVYAENQLVLPGLIDPHVHLREPGATHKEDFETGGRAAIAGGFTTVMDMPNNPVPTTTKEALDEKIALSQKALCDVLFHFGGTDDNFDEVKRADPDSLKLYLGDTTGHMMLKKPDSLKKHFKNFPKNRPIVLHVCTPDDNLESTYALQENAISLAAGRRIHIAHASTKKELTMAHAHENVTIEVTPHHLFLSTKDHERLGAMKEVLPHLRTEQKRIMLVSAMELADCIGSDHAPHTVEDKEEGAAGFPGLETTVGVMLDACSRGIIDKIWVVKAMSENPARLFSIPNKGKIEKGFAGDITIVDPKKEWKVLGGELETKCKWSPFEGKRLKGKTSTVIKDGKLVYYDYQFV